MAPDALSVVLALGTFFMLLGRYPGLGMMRINSWRAEVLLSSSSLMRQVGTKRSFRFAMAGVIAKDDDNICNET